MTTHFLGLFIEYASNGDGWCYWRSKSVGTAHYIGAGKYVLHIGAFVSEPLELVDMERVARAVCEDRERREKVA